MIVGYHHLWYLAGLIGAALTMLLIQRASSMSLVILVLLAYLAAVMFQYAGNYQVITEDPLWSLYKKFVLHRNFLFFCFPFFCLGYLISKHQLHTKVSTAAVTVIGAIGLIGLVLESYVNFNMMPKYVPIDALLFLVIACPAIFLAFLKSDIKVHSKQIALYSTGIYLIHALILILLEKWTSLKATNMTLATAVLAVVASFLLIKIHKKVRYIL